MASLEEIMFGVPRDRGVRTAVSDFGSGPASVPGLAPAVAPDLIVVFGAKGGVGKTFVATNLAIGLAQRGDRVLLVDLDLWGGNVGVHLDLLQGPTIIDTVSGLAVGGRSVTGKLNVSKHAPSGLDVVVGPAKPEQAELIDPEGVARLFQAAAGTYSITVVDTPPGGRDALTREALAQSTGVILVTTLDAGALRQTRLSLDFLKRLDFPGTRHPRVVVNQVYPGAAVNLRQVESFLSCRIDYALEEDRKTVEGTVFAGVPLVQGGPQGGLRRGLERIISDIRPGPAGNQKKGLTGGLWGRLRGGRG